MRIVYLSTKGFEKDLSGRGGMRENWLETNRENLGLNSERVAPPTGDHLGWQNAGIFPATLM